MVDQPASSEPSREQSLDESMFKSLIENSLDAIFITDQQGRFSYVNQVAAQVFGYDQSTEMVGLPATANWPPDDLPMLMESILPRASTGGWQGDVRQLRKDGSTFEASATIFPLTDAEGQFVAGGTILRDVTAQKLADAERERLQQEVIAAQQRAIAELSTPIIPVMDRIIVMPLVGSIDTFRARDLMRALLAGIREYRAKVVILDITGVPIVDTGVAAHLNKTIQAARLKGARTIVTGISDAVAEAVVDLGIDWRDIDTLSDLQTGLLFALNILGFKLTQDRVSG